MFGNIPGSKSNIYESDWSKFDREHFVLKNDPILKEECHSNYKKYRILLSAHMKKSKQSYYDKFFEKTGVILNTSEGVRSLISLKTVASS